MREKVEIQKSFSPALGFAILALGIAIGYFAGRQEQNPQAQAPDAPHSHAQALPNPAALAQNEALLKSILRSNPTDLSALVRLGNLYYDHGRFRDAVEWYGRALEQDPRNVNVRTDRGTSYWNLNDADSAIAEFLESLETDPGHPQTLYNLGVVYLHGKDDAAAAREAWLRLLAAHPDYPDRARVEAQIAALGTGRSAMTGSSKDGSVDPGMEDLLSRMRLGR